MSKQNVTQWAPQGICLPCRKRRRACTREVPRCSRCIEKGYDCAYRVAGSPRLSEGPTPSPPAGLSSPSGAPGTIFLVNGSLQSSPESTVTLPTKVNACYRCRKHRRRCSGGSPCKRCVQDHAECLASAPHLKRQSKKTKSFQAIKQESDDSGVNEDGFVEGVAVYHIQHAPHPDGYWGLFKPASNSLVTMSDSDFFETTPSPQDMVPFYGPHVGPVAFTTNSMEDYHQGPYFVFPAISALPGMIAAHYTASTMPLYHFDTTPMRPLAILPPLPGDDSDMQGLMSSYFQVLFLAFSLPIRSELLRGLSQRTIPDFLVYSLLFWSSWYHLNLPEVLGRQRHRHLFSVLYDRMLASLMPALEASLVGYDGHFSSSDESEAAGLLSEEEINEINARKLAYKEQVMAVGMSLVHITSVAMSFKNATDDPFSCLEPILLLTVKVVKAARLNEEILYHREPLSPHGPIPPLVEQGRRLWWMLSLMDKQVSIMYNRDAHFDVEECLGLPLHVSEAEFEERQRQGALNTVNTTIAARSSPPPPPSPRPNSARHERPADLSHIYAFSEASTRMVDYVVKRQASDEPIQATLPSLTEMQFLQHPQLVITPEMPFSPVPLYVRLVHLLGVIVDRRKADSRAYLEHPDRTALLADLHTWFDAWPAGVRDMDMLVLQKPEMMPQAGYPDDFRNVLHMVAYTLLMYHAAQVLLSSPSESVLWSSDMDYDWLGSDAFLKAQEHAIRATALLSRLIETRMPVQQLSAPWFQYCVVRTGLVHLKYLQIATAAVAAWKDEDFAENETARSQVVLLQEARGQVDVHTATLELGQLEGIRGKDGRGSYWFRSWLGAVKESDLALSG